MDLLKSSGSKIRKEEVTNLCLIGLRGLIKSQVEGKSWRNQG